MNVNPTQLSAAPIVAAALGRSIGVKVEFGAYSTASTDGSTIRLPRLPVELPAAVESILWGFIHHEAGHIRHSDYAALDDPEVRSDFLVLNLLRVFEDIRMERAHIGLYPGAGRVLSELVSELVRQSFFTPVESDEAASVFVDYCLKHLRTTVLGQTALAEQSAHARALLEGMLGTGFVTRLSAAITRGVLDATSTLDVLDLALHVRQYLQDEVDARDPPPSECGSELPSADCHNDGSSDASSHSGDRGELETSEGEGTASAAAEEQGSEPDDLGADPDDSADSSASSCSHDDTDAATADASDPCSGSGDEVSDASVDCLRSILAGSVDDPSLGDLGDALARLLADEVDACPGRVFGLPETEKSPGCPDNAAVSEARRVSTRLAVQLRRRLESVDSVPDVPKARGRRVSRRHLTRVALGDHRVFRSKVLGPEINTAVAILVDASDSMAFFGKIELACRAALATGLALDSIPRVESCVGAFPGLSGPDSVELLKGFSEESKSVSSRFSTRARGGTPLTEALIWAGHCLGMRPEERLVVYVATDGEPDDSESAKQMIARLQRAGIEVHGLGIETNDPLGLFDSFSRVTDVSQLAEAFLSLSDRTLKLSA